MTEDQRNHLLLYWSGELDPDEELRMEELLQSDSEVSLYLKDLKRLELLAEECTHAPTRGIASLAIATSLPEQKETVIPFPQEISSSTRRRLPLSLTLSSMAAGLAILFTIGVLVSHRPTPETVQSPSSSGQARKVNAATFAAAFSPPSSTNSKA
ncbi:MAG: hypothetical protein AAGJ31_03350, partial [Verrucomicrobiota bacterium]